MVPVTVNDGEYGNVKVTKQTSIFLSGNNRKPAEIWCALFLNVIV
jgi:hypothetical protein